MTNGEKYKTAEERINGFRQLCKTHMGCTGCPLAPERHMWECAFLWLDLEAATEQPLPCPFCGSTDVVVQDVGGFELACQGCGFHTPSYIVIEELISEYQRVARAVIAAKESEVK